MPAKRAKIRQTRSLVGTDQPDPQINPVEFWRARFWEFPDKKLWTDLYEDRRFTIYASSLRDKFGFIRFVGLPTQGGPDDTPIERLFVEPALSTARIDPALPPKEWPKTISLVDALIANPRLVVLGDPGAGKSTLISWIVLSLLSRQKNRLIDGIGQLLPLTLVLRDLNVEGTPTWDKLLSRFIAHPSGQSLGSPSVIEAALNRGQVLVLVDGLDEAGGINSRRAIVAALHNAFVRFPKARWVITSRVVAYDDVPVEFVRLSAEEDTSEKGGPPTNGTLHVFGSRLYVSPFDEARIAMFVRNWHEQHEPDRAERSTRGTELLEAIDRSEPVKALARIPNLLTMIALVYRVYLRLPDGRALLYERIAQAYLETIETARKLPTPGHTLEDMKRWLGYAAFQMQLARFEKDAADSVDLGILVSRDQLLSWIAFAMTRGLTPISPQQQSTANGFRRLGCTPCRVDHPSF